MILFLVVPISALIAGGVIRAIGGSTKRAVWTGLTTGAITFVVLIAVIAALFAECLDEDDNAELWPWSPRRELCSDAGSPAQLGALAIFLLPTVLICLGAFLRSRGRRTLGTVAYAALLPTIVLPFFYVQALPAYAIDEYPVLHKPLLRVARGSEPPRVCYVNGILGETRTTPATTRECIDLVPTPAALRLTAAYDEGVTFSDLEAVGVNLTREGLPIEPGETGVDGLVVARAYRLPEAEAAVGASEID
jgi:hypothetical protein